MNSTSFSKVDGNPFLEVMPYFPSTLTLSLKCGEEASIIGLNALNIRENQERHEAFEKFGVPLVGLDIEKIKVAINLLENEPKNKRVIVNDYSEDNFSSKIVNIILSHINYINKYVWRKKL